MPLRVKRSRLIFRLSTIRHCQTMSGFLENLCKRKGEEKKRLRSFCLKKTINVLWWKRSTALEFWVSATSHGLRSIKASRLWHATLIRSWDFSWSTFQSRVADSQPLYQVNRDVKRCVANSTNLLHQAHPFFLAALSSSDHLSIIETDHLLDMAPLLKLFRYSNPHPLTLHHKLKDPTHPKPSHQNATKSTTQKSHIHLLQEFPQSFLKDISAHQSVSSITTRSFRV